MAKVSERKEVEKFLLRIQDKELSPIIALLSSIRVEISEIRSACRKTDGSYDREIFKLCLSVEYPKLAAAVERLKKVKEKIEKEIL